mgnify:CR=1 FL=1
MKLQTKFLSVLFIKIILLLIINKAKYNAKAIRNKKKHLKIKNFRNYPDLDLDITGDVVVLA